MKPLVLVILDGWGLRPDAADNGITQAVTPNMNHWMATVPMTMLAASGPAVGLPQGIMGNSEVGHMNIGAGRIVYTGLSQIYRAIEDGSFFQNKVLCHAVQAAKTHHKKLHLMGLISDGAVHSHQDHLYALIELAKREGLHDVCVHCFMDGRDTPPRDGIKYIRQLEAVLQQKGVGVIASVSGRYYAMDRDQRWDRVERAYLAMTGAGSAGEASGEQIMQKSYDRGVGDEFVVPQVVLDREGHPIGPIEDGDSVIFFNFRADRARELTRAFTENDFPGFERPVFPYLSDFVCMSPYDDGFDLPVAFEQNLPKRVFAELISEQGLKQLRLAETEKYAHVTFFINGGVETVYPGEERILVPSPREVATYDLKPEMSAPELERRAIEAIHGQKYDMIIMNFANADMVGHTAKPDAIKKCVSLLDNCLGNVVSQIMKVGGCACITADHGNAEQMLDQSGNPHTAHTTNPVPFMVISEDARLKLTNLRSGGRLCDIAPTLLEILGIKQPPEMTGKSLFTSGG